MSNPVAEAFARASKDYHRCAPVQTASAENLARVCANADPQRLAPETILELGCGSGILTQRVRPIWRQARYLATDIAPAVLREITEHQGIDRIAFDATRPAIKEKSIDLVISNFALQWLPDPVAGIASLRNLLKKDGRLIVALPIKDTCREWTDLCAQHGVASGFWQYPSQDQFAASLPGAQMELVPMVHNYASATDFVRAIKTIGANTPLAGHHPMTSAQMRGIFATAPRPFPVTYQVLTIVA